MDKLAKELIKKRIEILIDEWDFEKRKKNNLKECICYKKNKKCHDVENLNCLFCYCPNYDANVPEGRCKINSISGKYIENSNCKILDCSDCGIPHDKENVKNMFLKIYF